MKERLPQEASKHTSPRNPRSRATRFITQLLRLSHKNSVNRPQKKINSRFTYIITLLQMYHQSRVSGKSEAAFVIRRQTHNALSIIAEPVLVGMPKTAVSSFPFPFSS